MKNFYESTVQVKFWDADNNEWNYGIAYEDHIICGCCGGVFEIDEVIEYGLECGIQNPIHEYKTWIDLSQEIYGGVEPASYIEEEENA